MTHVTKAALAAMVTAGSLLAGGCGDDDEDPAATQTPTAPAVTAPTGGAVEVEVDAVEAGGELSFSEDALQVAAGTVTLKMDSPRGNKLPHAIAIEGGNGQSRSGLTVNAGGTSTVTVPLVAGDYTYFCPVGDHRRQGMEGALVVE